MDERPRPARWALLGALVALLTAFQFAVMERTPEQAEERRYSNISELPAGSALLTYIGTLLTGPFRAVAIDYLWIQYSELADQKRYTEARDIMELICMLQPHNRGAIAELGQMLCKNMPAVAPAGQRYGLYRDGLLLLRKGIRANPGDPELCYELAWQLYQTATWREGWFDEELVQHVRDDEKLQAELRPDGAWDGKKRTPMALSRPWFERARDLIIEEMARHENQPWRNQGGVWLSPEGMDTLVLLGLYKEAMWRWYAPRRSHAEALETLREAIAYDQHILNKYGAWLSFIYGRRLAMYRKIEEIIRYESLSPAAPADASPEQRAAWNTHALELLRMMEEEIVEFETLDDGYVYVPARDLKRTLTRDAGEIDDVPYGARIVPARTEGPVEIPANLAPPGRDLDIAYLQPPATELVNPPPASASLDVANRSSVPIHARIVTLVGGNFVPVTEAIIEPHGIRSFSDIELDYKKATYLFISPARMPESMDDPILYVIRRMK